MLQRRNKAFGYDCLLQRTRLKTAACKKLYDRLYKSLKINICRHRIPGKSDNRFVIHNRQNHRLSRLNGNPVDQNLPQFPQYMHRIILRTRAGSGVHDHQIIPGYSLFYRFPDLFIIIMNDRETVRLSSILLYQRRKHPGIRIYDLTVFRFLSRRDHLCTCGNDPDTRRRMNPDLQDPSAKKHADIHRTDPMMAGQQHLSGHNIFSDRPDVIPGRDSSHDLHRIFIYFQQILRHDHRVIRLSDRIPGIYHLKIFSPP